MKLSVHIVTKGRLELLRLCVGSVFRELPPQSEVVVVINGVNPSVENFLSGISDSRLRWKATARSTLTRCRNDAFLECRGEFIFCLDDDVVIPNSYFVRVLGAFESDPKLAVVGGPNLTPPQSAYFQKLSGAVMTSTFAAPMVLRRYGGGNQAARIADERDLIFCNLAIRKSLIPSGVRFREHLIANEENMFLYELGQYGLKAIFLPTGYVYHWRRKTLREFFLQMRHYGRGRAQQFLLRPSSCHPLFMVPSLTIILALALILWPGRGHWFAGLILVHQGVSLVSALFSREVRRLGFFAVLFVVPLTALVHIGYGFGFWGTLIRSFRRRMSKEGAVASVYSEWIGGMNHSQEAP